MIKFTVEDSGKLEIVVDDAGVRRTVAFKFDPSRKYSWLQGLQQAAGMAVVELEMDRCVTEPLVPPAPPEVKVGSLVRLKVFSDEEADATPVDRCTGKKGELVGRVVRVQAIWYPGGPGGLVLKPAAVIDGHYLWPLSALEVVG